jgi:hypothetical protein
MRISDRSLAILSLVVGVILGLGGIISGYYFYIQSIQERIPTFLISPVRVSIVKSDSNDLTDLSILYKGKPVTQKNVIAVRIYMWNSGKLPISKSDVLKPIRFVFPEDAKILDYKILKYSRDVSNIQISSTNGSNILDLTFDILEHNDGVAIQVIYAGPLNAKIDLLGSVIGVPTLHLQTAYTSKHDMPWRQQFMQEVSGVRGIGSSLFIIMILIAGIAQFGRKYRTWFSGWGIIIPDVILIISMSGLIAFSFLPSEFQILAGVPTEISGNE